MASKIENMKSKWKAVYIVVRWLIIAGILCGVYRETGAVTILLLVAMIIDVDILKFRK